MNREGGGYNNESGDEDNYGDYDDEDRKSSDGDNMEPWVQTDQEK